MGTFAKRNYPLWARTFCGFCCPVHSTDQDFLSVLFLSRQIRLKGTQRASAGVVVIERIWNTCTYWRTQWQQGLSKTERGGHSWWYVSSVGCGSGEPFVIAVNIASSCFCWSTVRHLTAVCHTVSAAWTNRVRVGRSVSFVLFKSTILKQEGSSSFELEAR